MPECIVCHLDTIATDMVYHQENDVIAQLDANRDCIFFCKSCAIKHEKELVKIENEITAKCRKRENLLKEWRLGIV